MSKILVVMGEPYTNRERFREVWPELCKKAGFEETVVCDASEAIEVFIEENPTHVIVINYVGVGDVPGKVYDGYTAWKDISLAASPEVKVLRSGWFRQLDEPDYLRLPFREEELAAAFRR